MSLKRTYPKFKKFNKKKKGELLMSIRVPLLLKLIKYKGGTSLSDVGLLHNEHAHTRQEDKAVRVSSLTGYKV